MHMFIAWVCFLNINTYKQDIAYTMKITSIVTKRSFSKPNQETCHLTFIRFFIIGSVVKKVLTKAQSYLAAVYN